VDSCGIVASVEPHHVARQIVDEAKACRCDAIIVGSTRLRGIRRIAGSGVRDRILRTSALPVLVAPPPIGGRHRIPKLTHDRATVR
jgi:nucleotide-binding universal stress UspA family protein